MASQQPRWLIIDFFAALVRRFDDRVAISHLVQLMEELEMDEQTVRSSVSRLKRKGWLVPDRLDGQAAYRISPTALQELADGDSRVYHLEPANLDDGWCLAAFSIPESLRSKRHALRSRLTWWGFGNLAPGVWIAPQRSAAHARRIFEQLGVEEYTFVFESRYAGTEPLNDFVQQAWDFPKLSAKYAAFLEERRPLLEKWRSREVEASAEAFVDYLRMINSWRSIPFLDPGLPEDLLPAGWKGTQATQLFHELSDLLLEPAIGHVEAVTGRERLKDPVMASA